MCAFKRDVNNAIKLLSNKMLLLLLFVVLVRVPCIYVLIHAL
jgi:hypothetical protein